MRHPSILVRSLVVQLAIVLGCSAETNAREGDLPPADVAAADDVFADARHEDGLVVTDGAEGADVADTFANADSIPDAAAPDAVAPDAAAPDAAAPDAAPDGTAPDGSAPDMGSTGAKDALIDTAPDTLDAGPPPFGLTVRAPVTTCSLTKGPDVPPKTLSETGCFADLGKRTPASGLIPFDVNAPLWSDDTIKRRWMALPGTTKIGYVAAGAWDFPVGTILIKEFVVETTVGVPSTRKAIETRFLLKTATDWQGYTYEWNDAQTEATLSGGSTKSYTITTATGSFTLQYAIPSSGDCLKCHVSTAGFVLGTRTAQMNRSFDYGTVVDNQIRAMANIALFTTDPGSPSLLPRYPDPFGPSAGLELRSRAYLQGNCMHCHHPSGPTGKAIDLRYETPLSATRMCNVVPETSDLGVAGARILAPGAPSRSTLWLRMDQRGADQMPPLATSRVHAAATTLISDWISVMAACP